jgi:2-aminoadipate transaminase
VPGAAFYADNADETSLRLSFVTASIEQINTGVAALAAAIRENRPGRAASPGGLLRQAQDKRKTEGIGAQ